MAIGNRVLYIFIDEAGNFDFSKNGTDCFVITSLSRLRPFDELPQLLELKYNLWESGLEIPYFHATEDKQKTRDEVFKIITNNIANYRADSIIVDKPKTYPTLQNDRAEFFKKVLKILLKYVFYGLSQPIDLIYIVTDSLPLGKQNKAFEKALKIEMAYWINQLSVPYVLQHHDSKSDLNLQIVDYINWAIFRKWERHDYRSYRLIHACVKSEFDVFGIGRTRFY